MSSPDPEERSLICIERRLDAFDDWFKRVIGSGDGYELQEALDDWARVEQNVRQLIERARARGDE